MGKITSESSDKGPVQKQKATSSGSAPQPLHGSVPQFMAARSPRMQHSFVPPPPASGLPAGYPVMQHDPLTFNTQSNENLYLQALQQTIQDSNAVTQAILAGGLGAGGVSGVGGGFGAAGFGGGGGIQQLNLMQFYSGGGEQELVLHALLNGSGGVGGTGGGGIDVSQSILSANESLDRLGGIK